MVEDSRTVDRPDTNELKVESLAKLWTGKNEKTKTHRKNYIFSVIGQPATGLLVKVLKMRHKNELSGGHWTFMRKM